MYITSNRVTVRHYAPSVAIKAAADILGELDAKMEVKQGEGAKVVVKEEEGTKVVVMKEEEDDKVVVKEEEGEGNGAAAATTAAVLVKKEEEEEEEGGDAAANKERRRPNATTKREREKEGEDGRDVAAVKREGSDDNGGEKGKPQPLPKGCRLVGALEMHHSSDDSSTYTYDYVISVRKHGYAVTMYIL